MSGFSPVCRHGADPGPGLRGISWPVVSGGTGERPWPLCPAALEICRGQPPRLKQVFSQGTGGFLWRIPHPVRSLQLRGGMGRRPARESVPGRGNSWGKGFTMVFFLAGGLAGTVFGVLAAGFMVRWLQGAREKRALAALITQMHLKRALAESGPGAMSPDFDAARCRSAVADIRQQVRDTLSELRPGSSSPAAALLEMHRACDAYLRETEGNGRNFEARMRELRPVLNQSARRLSSGRHVQYLAPGQRAAVRKDPTAGDAHGRSAARARENARAWRVGGAPLRNPSGSSHGKVARIVPHSRVTRAGQRQAG